MKTIKNSSICLLILLFAQIAKAQVIELTEGSLSAIKGSALVNVQYDFSKLTVNGYPTIEDYITYKKKKYEEFHKGTKPGSEWEQNWKVDRETVMIPRIQEVMNRKLEKCGMSTQLNASAKYTFIVKITHYLESNAGFPYFIGYVNMFEAKVYLVETANPDKKLATIRADYLKDVGDLGGSIGNLICKLLK